MKIITKAVSVVLTMALLISVAMCAPFSAGAEEKDVPAQSTPAQSNNTPKAEESYSVDFDSVVEVEDAQPADESSAEQKNNGKPAEEAVGAPDDNEPAAAVAETTVGDFSYIEVDGKVYITCYNGSDSEVTFPAQIDGKDVYGLDKNGKQSCLKNKNVTKVIISEGIECLKNASFYSCSNLKTVELPDTLTTIETDCFCLCTGLENIELPENLTYIGKWAFSCCIIKEVYIPESAQIDKYAFSGCTELKKVYWPKTNQKKIEYQAFNFCTSLSDFTFPDGIETIGSNSFFGCNSLKQINLPESVTTIGSSAFSACTSLEQINLPGNLTTIENSAFDECKSLKQITFPKSLTSIGESAFSYTGLESVTITNNITGLGASAFSNCENLEIVTVEEGVTTLSESCFQTCKALGQVDLPDGFISVNKKAFSGCKGLKQINLPDSLTTIGESAFSYSGLESITILKNITNIGDWVFSYCNKLKDVYFEDGTTTVSPVAFGYCPSIKEVELPDSITTISASAFYGCTGLERITFPENLEYIGENTFINCYSLKEITIPESTEIERYAFGGSGLTKVNWEKTNQKAIKDYTFANCSNLTEFTVPDGIEAINIYAFYNTGLKSIVLPESVVSIGDSAFRACKSLEQIKLPDNLNTLGNGSFSSCESLKEIKIPEKIRVLGAEMFSHCKSLTDVYANDDIDFTFGYGAYYYNDSFFESNNVTVHCGSKYSATARNAANHNYAFDFKYIDRDEDSTEIIDTKNSSYYINSGAAKTLVCNYAFKDEVYADAANKNVLIHLPLGMEITAGQFYVDGQKTTNYKFDTNSRVYTIPVSNQSGRIVMYIANEDNGYNLRTYAALQCKTNGNTVTETIDIHNEFVGAMTISANSTTSDGNVKVEGSGPKSTTVSLYVDNTLCGTAETNKVGSFSAEISIPNPVNTLTYKIEARAINASGKEVKAAAYTQYVKSAPKLTGFWLIPKKVEKGLDLPTIDLMDPNTKARMYPGTSDNYIFALQFENAEDIEKIILSSTKDGKTGNYNIQWDETRKMFVSGSIYIDYDKNTEFYPPPVAGKNPPAWLDHLPGRLSIAIETKPVEPEINYNWANAMAEKAKSIAAENDYIVSTNIKSKTDNSVNLEINTKDGTVNSHVDKGSAGDFINNHPDIAGYTGDGTIHGGLSDFSNNPIPGTEASVNPNISDVGKNMTEGQLIDSVKKNWAPTPTPDGNLYTNVSVNDNGVNFCTFNPVSGQFALNTMAFGANFVGLAAGKIPSAFVAGVTGAAGLVIGITASVYQNVNYMNNMSDLYNALYKQVITSIDDPVNQQLAKNALFKMSMLACLGGLASIVGDTLIAIGFAAFWMNPLAGLGLIALGIGVNLFAGWLKEKSNGEYNKVLMYLYAGSPLVWVIDPSGYVYAGLESNRIPGATATVYGIIKDDEIDDATFWDEPDESRQVKWVAEEYDQINPQITDYYGFYQWDVPIGWWRVEIKADGYETYTTEWMQVPPPQVDVNIGLTTTKAPAIISADEEDDGYTITFEDCMKPESLNNNITLTDKKGREINYTLEYTAETSPIGEELVKTVKLVFDVNSGSTDKFFLSMTGTENYSGITGDVSYTLKPNRNPLENVTASLPDDTALRRGGTVTLSNANSDAVIYYTTDGTDPSDDENPSRQVYSEPIIINEDTTVKTCATARGFNESDISSYSYYIAEGAVGDVNNDGTVDILDAMTIQKYAVNKINFNAVERFLADVNNDGTVDVLDAADIQKYTVEKLKSFKKV